MSRNKLLNIGIAIVALAFLSLGYFHFKKDKPARILPVYGPAGHTVRDFRLIDQAGNSITQSTMAGKVYVLDYFFTTCPSICPIMSNQMKRAYEKFKGNELVAFISHTVDPETDSVPVLAKYAQDHGADAGQWHFVTGDKKELYDLARKSYFLDPGEGKGDAEDFIHTPMFVLVDREKRIRGYYDGTNASEVDKMIAEIELLLQEYRYKGE